MDSFKNYDADKSDLVKKISDVENKIRDASRLVKKTNYNAKITEIESKIPSISSLATNSALTQFKIKYLMSVIYSRNKKDYDTKISETEKKVTNHNHDKYITTPEFNRLTTEDFAAR